MSTRIRTHYLSSEFKLAGLCCILACILVLMNSCRDRSPSPNVLFISVDDWNDRVGCLGDSVVQTPQLDRLAGMGMLFTNAHCSAPVCNPSRASLMTGLMPSTTGVYNNAQPVFAKFPDLVSIPRHFRNNDYIVEGGGKTYHEQIGFNNPDDWDYYFLWDEANRENGWWGHYSYPPAPQPDIRPEHPIAELTVRNFDWAALDVPDTWMPDHKVATWARYFLSRKHDRPFFLATGIFKPHVPWFVPREYFELYNIEDIKLPPYKPDDLEDVPETGRKIALDSRSKHDKVVEMGLWKEAIRAYYASISHSDRQVGRILDGLAKSDYLENTIIVLWSDHGYHLGEKDHWHKLTLWERATRVPLIIVAPGITTPGSVCKKPVSLIDLYPTLIELCNLPSKPELDGHSLVPLLRDPDAEWEYPAITTRDKNNHAIRTEQFRYIRYYDGTEELYDHLNDPNEWTNLAEIEKYGDIISELRKWLPAENAEDAPHKTKDLYFNKEEYKWYRKPEFTTICKIGETSIENVDDSRYTACREPNAVVTDKGTLVVVFGPHDLDARNDRAHQDLICRTSKDNGSTWSPARRIMDYDMESLLPTTLIYDKETSKLILLVNVIFNAPEREDPKGVKTPCEHYILISDDEGQNWSKPRPILEDEAGICVFGGGHGIQLQHGEYSGRLLVPGGIGPNGSIQGVFYSDDHGDNWAFSENGRTGNTEATACELDDATILFNWREQKSQFGVQTCTSRDGGITVGELGRGGWDKKELGIYLVKLSIDWLL